MSIRLHCFAQSGNAYKVALMLDLLELDWEPVYVDFFNGGSKTDEFLALNEMGEVPTIEIDGQVLSQSGVILDHLAGKYERFGAQNQGEHAEILRWVLFDNHKVSSIIGVLRFLRAFAKQDEGPVTAFLEKRATGALAVLERRLADRDYVVGNGISIADMSLAGYLYYPVEESRLPLDPYPQIQAWLNRIKALPGWRHPYDAMPGHPLPA